MRQGRSKLCRPLYFTSLDGRRAATRVALSLALYGIICIGFMMVCFYTIRPNFAIPPIRTKPMRYASQQTTPSLDADALRTRDGHRVAFAVAGALDGVPVVVLHGGPGSGSQPSVLKLFDLTRFKVVLIDQRGTGASRPFGSVRNNRTAQLCSGQVISDRQIGSFTVGFAS